MHPTKQKIECIISTANYFDLTMKHESFTVNYNKKIKKTKSVFSYKLQLLKKRKIKIYLRIMSILKLMVFAFIFLITYHLYNCRTDCTSEINWWCIVVFLHCL